MLHAVENVFPLHIFDPNLQLLLRDKAVFVSVHFIHDDAAERLSVVMKAFVTFEREHLQRAPSHH